MADTADVPEAGNQPPKQSESEVRQAQSGKLRDKAKKVEEEKMDQKKRDQLKAAQREKLLAARNQAYVLNYLERKTKFDKEQIRVLQKMYRAFKHAKQKDIDRLRFREMVASLLGITDNVMLDRIFNAFDGDNEGSVSESEWIIGLSIQLRGTLDQQIAYAYDVYDFNGDRGLGREEIHACLHKSLHVINGVLEGDEMDDAIHELVELSMKKFDISRDQQIRFSEYRHIARRDPTLLEAFGECLPTERAAMPIVSLLDYNPRSYSHFLSPPGDSAWVKERERYRDYKASAGHEGYVIDTDADEGKALSPSNSGTNANNNNNQEVRKSDPPTGAVKKKGLQQKKRGFNRRSR